MELGNFRQFIRLFVQDVKMAIREKAKLIVPILFYVMMLVIYCFFFSLTPQALQAVAPIFIWMTLLVSSLFAINEFFTDERGYFELLRTSRDSRLGWVIYSKILSSWLLTIVPILFLTVLISILVNLSFFSLEMILISFLLGTWILFFMGALIRSLTMKLENSVFLLPILLVPLFLPVLIVGVSCAIQVMAGRLVYGHLALLLAMTIIVTTFIPWTITYIMRLPD